MTACNTTKNTTNSPNSLQGEWVLTYISGPRIAFDGLYPGQKPVINFDIAGQKVFGKNSCNSYSGKLTIEDGVVKIGYGYEHDGDGDGRPSSGIKAEAFADMPEILDEAKKDSAAMQTLAKWFDLNKGLLPKVEKEL